MIMFDTPSPIVTLFNSKGLSAIVTKSLIPPAPSGHDVFYGRPLKYWRVTKSRLQKVAAIQYFCNWRIAFSFKLIILGSYAWQTRTIPKLKISKKAETPFFTVNRILYLFSAPPIVKNANCKTMKFWKIWNFRFSLIKFYNTNVCLMS
jgi:hypothetical protein